MKKYIIKQTGILVFFLVFVSSCGDDAVVLPELFKPEVEETKPGEPKLKKTVNWDNRSNGAYSTATAKIDLGNSLTGWKPERTDIVDKTLCVKLEKNALSGAGGITANVDLEEGTEYEVEFKVKFDNAFDWSRGGKVGFGFRIGDGNTGCDKADDGNGGSARLMWYTSDNGVTRFKPYLYYKDMPGQCGDDMGGTTFPSSGSIKKNVWYTVKIYVKSNTGDNTDGRVKFTIDDQVILDKPIRWTTNDAKRTINRLSFSTFRGGSESYWESDTDGFIYFDDMTWKKFN